MRGSFTLRSWWDEAIIVSDPRSCRMLEQVGEGGKKYLNSTRNVL